MAVPVGLQLVGFRDTELPRNRKLKQIHRLFLLIDDDEVGFLECRTQVGRDRAAASRGVAGDVTVDSEGLCVHHLDDVVQHGIVPPQKPATFEVDFTTGKNVIQCLLVSTSWHGTATGGTLAPLLKVVGLSLVFVGFSCMKIRQIDLNYTRHPSNTFSLV